MLPVFKPGAIAPVSAARPRPGDCAVYCYKGRTLLHRVIKVSAQGAWLADDAGRLELHFVPWTDVRGRALGGLLAGGLSGRLYSALRRGLYKLFNA